MPPTLSAFATSPTTTSVRAAAITSSSPRRCTTCMDASEDARLAHDGFGLRADLARDFVGIALLELRKKQLDGERASVALLGKLSQDFHERRDAVARDEARRLIEQLA